MRLVYYIMKRIVYLIPLLLGILLITFVLARVVPADPAALYAGPQHSDPASLERIRKAMGLDKPWHIQFLDFILEVLKGNLGFSWHTGRPVMEELSARFPVTLELTLISMLMALGMGIPLGILSALRRESKIDKTVRGVSYLGVGIPNFWLALLMIFLFYYTLRVLPSSGRLSIGISPPPKITGMILLDSLLSLRFDAFVDGLKHLIMPAFCLSFGMLAHVIRLVRASMLEVLRQDYIVYARSKGLPERVVIYKHALRNAIIPTVAWTGMVFGSMLGGSVIIEYIFGIPGMGSYAYESVIYFDYAPVQVTVMIMTIIFCVVNLIVDILYALIDPRIRLG